MGSSGTVLGKRKYNMEPGNNQLHSTLLRDIPDKHILAISSASLGSTCMSYTEAFRYTHILCGNQELSYKEGWLHPSANVDPIH